MLNQDIITSGLIDVKPLITHRFELKNGLKAFSVAMKAEGLKVALNP